jgi:hypothetical protein
MPVILLLSRDQEEHGLKPARGHNSQESYLKITLHTHTHKKKKKKKKKRKKERKRKKKPGLVAWLKW